MAEEIIIDGIDVAECKYYTTMEDCDGIHDLCEQLDDYCSTKKDCYYKQLKRLEQENKELKETIKQYCEWLDEERESNDKLQKVYQNDHCDLLNYRSALEEIKENLVKLKTNDEDDFTYEYSKIEDKINEVLK